MQILIETDGCIMHIVTNVLKYRGRSHVLNNHSILNSFALLNAIKHKLRQRFILFWEKRMAEEEGLKKVHTYKTLKITVTLKHILKQYTILM